ncbi:Phosphoserine aminotransferase [Cymbomonas tetramitiformis]|uniref:Phosphoserine aminotransferase n=1 Tax=Cymbomonas tetramitiformis TaxID=36881 RepID=A0AAE0G4B4_9CHLO|nr:Phosphoserine aminotransferase [Cymbomonas tetramitiformis]
MGNSESSNDGKSGSSKGRIYNFSAGPAMLPVDVLEQAQKDMLNWNGSGMGVMEMSHRGKEFVSIAKAAEADLRTLLKIPENYKVLFMQGGATTQFAAIPFNLTTPEDTIDFVETGAWSTKAIKEAKKYCKVNVAATSKAENFTHIPEESNWTLTPGGKLVHICYNETIGGVEFKDIPRCADDVTLVADMSSDFLSKPVDVSKFGMIYAGAQKNVGPAGVTIVIIREDLIGKARADCPAMFDYKLAADNDSMYNTPPCYGIYICGLVFKKLLSIGGLEKVEEYNLKKCALIYDAIDGSEGFYKAPVAKNCRSCMNIPFTMASKELETEFFAEAAKRNMVQLAGHKSVGGIRVSVYNAMPMEGAEAIAQLMQELLARSKQ